MEYKSKSMTIKVRPDDIVETITNEASSEGTVEEAKETIELITKAIDGKTRGILSIMPSSYMSKEVMDLYNSANMGECATAMIATSFGAKVLGNFFIKLMGKSNKNNPVKLFSNKADAEKWLLERIAEAKNN